MDRSKHQIGGVKTGKISVITPVKSQDISLLSWTDQGKARKKREQEIKQVEEDKIIEENIVPKTFRVPTKKKTTKLSWGESIPQETKNKSKPSWADSKVEPKKDELSWGKKEKKKNTVPSWAREPEDKPEEDVAELDSSIEDKLNESFGKDVEKPIVKDSLDDIVEADDTAEKELEAEVRLSEIEEVEESLEDEVEKDVVEDIEDVDSAEATNLENDSVDSKEDDTTDTEGNETKESGGSSEEVSEDEVKPSEDLPKETEEPVAISEEEDDEPEDMDPRDIDAYAELMDLTASTLNGEYSLDSYYRAVSRIMITRDCNERCIAYASSMVYEKDLTKDDIVRGSVVLAYYLSGIIVTEED